jgi:hypothetical protein
MRLAMSFFILVVTALDFRFGQPELGLQLANMVAGMLLALSVIVDHLLPMTNPVPPPAAPDTAQAEPTRTMS